MELRKLWLIFAQAATVGLAIVFVLATLKPEWIARQGLPSAPRAIPSPPPAPAALPAATQPQLVAGFRDAATRAMPAVVNIFTSKQVGQGRHPLLDDPLFRYFFGDRPDGEPRRTASLGSGVVVSPEGYILTNHHVVETADDIEIALANGRKLPARIVGSDPESDLAVLRVEAKALASISFGRNDSLRVGDVVLAIGNPFGVGQTVTMGIVSAIGRNHLGINTYEDFIQTDAAINPGNSGGALIDTAGNLIGINTAIYSRTGGSMGIGFAIPASNARYVMEQIISTGSVTRGWIGVEVQPITSELAESFGLNNNQGALIAGVLAGAPAHRAGMKPGDILVEIDARPVADTQQMLNLIAALKPGNTSRFKVLRDRSLLELAVEVGRRPPAKRLTEDQ